MFLKNSWYVFGWSDELKENEKLVGRVIIEMPVVVWRNPQGRLMAAEDRCPHRHAPLSFGRVEGDNIRCMYHGMAFNKNGECVDVPMVDKPPKCSIRMFPVIEKNDWIWVWMGDPKLADEAFIPDAWGVNDPNKAMRYNSIEYDAHYQLVHDNLCDLSHVDFVHEKTLRPATGAYWAETLPVVAPQSRAVRFERWFENAQMPSDASVKVDTWSTYEFVVPGIFILYGARFPAGTAKKCDYKAPSKDIKPIFENIEQQAVTPISATKTAYHYATGLIFPAKDVTKEIEARMDVVMKTFEEDRQIIEAQQKIWHLTDPSIKKQFLPQDQGPSIMRRLMDRLMKEE
ncbi:Rieske 2Fe-2S domain-containing protein [Marinomonas sp.]|uniref:Rieske 2Fe-2S domain-containing protein n=1 Tax=Marinomonas sp. TaxID=1904862 RepID=UPI003BAA7596